MKLLRDFLTLNILLTVVILNAGNSGGNGGELAGLQFTQSAQEAAIWLSKNQDLDWIQKFNKQFAPLSFVEAFYKSIDQTKIEVTDDKLFLDGIEKTAINFSELQLIQINRFQWGSQTKVEKIALAAHEHFGIIGVDDRNYRYSSQIISKIEDNNLNSALTVIAGRPNTNIGGIDEILDQNIILNPEQPDTYFTTMIFSILKLHQIKSVSNIQILDKTGTTDHELLIRAIQKSSAISLVVLMPLGPITDLICESLADNKGTIFVLPAGSQASYFEPPMQCLQNNIIFVSYLNREKDNLAQASNYGENVTLAAPGTEISTFDEEGRPSKVTSGSGAVALIASALVKYSKTKPTLIGADLVEAFLKSETVMMPALKGKTKAARAWLD